METLWIISELFPPDETSTSYILGEIANAASKVYDVHVICGPAVYDARKKLDQDHPFQLDPSVKVKRTDGLGIDKNATVGKARSFLAMSKRIYKLAKDNIKEGEKVLLVTNPAPLILLMSRLRSRCEFELNVLVHDVFPENIIPAGLHLPSYVFQFAKRLFDRAYSRADKLFAIGRDMADVLRHKTGEKVQIMIVENWGDVESIKPLPFPDGPVKIEYAGNIGRVQGLDKLVDELPENVDLHFYGTGAMEENLKSKKHKNVFFHGPFFRSQQEEVLGAAHASVVTLSEGMFGLGVPSKAYNIMAAGRPIIYFGPEKGEIGLLIQEYDIGYIGWPEKWDIDDLRAKGFRARILAEQKYSKDAILKKFITALR